jgi:23S rRNA (uracil1939-C5)-methyltransferase
VLVGFHERASSYIADMRECRIMPRAMSDLLVPLRELIAGMSRADRLPQIEVAIGLNEGVEVTALALRHMEPNSEADLQRLRDFAAAHSAPRANPPRKIEWWLQPKGPDTLHTLDDAPSELAYELSEFGIRMPFKPADFTQVNHQINDVLVGRALRLLDAQPHERVIDWFCGLGNFTLPLATRARDVLGIEGSTTLVQRAQANARAAAEDLKKNSENVGIHAHSVAIKTGALSFQARNLFEMSAEQLAADGVADKWLVDPPREGAFALAKALADWHQAVHGIDAPSDEDTDAQAAPRIALSAAACAWVPPQRIVYVSCNPATLARDAGLLVHQAGYRCTHAGVVNMFPHTAHVESIAVFDRA